MKKAPKIINLSLLLITSLMSNICVANPTPPQPLGPPVGPGLPIDNGILVLAVAAVLYSLYFFRKRNYSK
ncbi:MAG: hypothetical protein V4670_06680 [Bacteroidota bacterium]